MRNVTEKEFRLIEAYKSYLKDKKNVDASNKEFTEALRDFELEQIK